MRNHFIKVSREHDAMHVAEACSNTIAALHAKSLAVQQQPFLQMPMMITDPHAAWTPAQAMH